MKISIDRSVSIIIPLPDRTSDPHHYLNSSPMNIIFPAVLRTQSPPYQMITIMMQKASILFRVYKKNNAITQNLEKNQDVKFQKNMHGRVGLRQTTSL